MAATQGDLGPREVALLAFERDWTLHQGTKRQAIREHFGISAARYYRLLARVVDNPAAMAHDPLTIRRLRKRRSELARRRAAAAPGVRRGQ